MPWDSKFRAQNQSHHGKYLQDLLLWQRRGHASDHPLPLRGLHQVRAPRLLGAVDQGVGDKALRPVQVHVCHGVKSEAPLQVGDSRDGIL